MLMIQSGPQPLEPATLMADPSFPCGRKPRPRLCLGVVCLLLPPGSILGRFICACGYSKPFLRLLLRTSLPEQGRVRANICHVRQSTG